MILEIEKEGTRLYSVENLKGAMDGLENELIRNVAAARRSQV